MTGFPAYFTQPFSPTRTDVAANATTASPITLHSSAEDQDGAGSRAKLKCAIVDLDADMPPFAPHLELALAFQLIIDQKQLLQ